jgi:hypothetical protein
MTEEVWLGCDYPQPMLQFLRGAASDRKLRLFACACCRRRIGSGPSDEVLLRAVRVAEDHVEGLAEPGALAAVYAAAGALAELPSPVVGWDNLGALEYLDWLAANVIVGVCAPAVGVDDAADVASSAADLVALAGATDIEQDAQSGLVRDIFGNPFRRVTIDSSWRVPFVHSLAQAAYDERILPGGELDPQRLAVLADALEEVGAAQDVFGHLRGLGPHVRGCWVVDLCLGKQ